MRKRGGVFGFRGDHVFFLGKNYKGCLDKRTVPRVPKINIVMLKGGKTSLRLAQKTVEKISGSRRKRGGGYSQGRKKKRKQLGDGGHVEGTPEIAQKSFVWGPSRGKRLWKKRALSKKDSRT